MSRNLNRTIADMRSDLGDAVRSDLGDAGTTWADAELKRCIHRAVADLSRVLPRERVYELTISPTVSSESFTTLKATSAAAIVSAYSIATIADGDAAATLAGQPDQPRPVKLTITDANTSITAFVVTVQGVGRDYGYVEETFYFSGGLVQTGSKYFRSVTAVVVERIKGAATGDTLSLGTGDPTGIWVQLAYKPIKPSSDSITSYTRDTDYIMDYDNGRIALKSGGSMAAETAYSVSYTKSEVKIDISSLDDLIRVDRVEYPARNIPQTFQSFEAWGDTIVLLGESPEGQSSMADKEHAVVRYTACQQPPEDTAPGSYPAFLDSTIELAAEAYALFMKAYKLEHQAATDVASARTALGNCAALHTLAGTALAAAATALAAATTALGDTFMADFLSGDAVPSAKKYLVDGDELINQVTLGVDVGEGYASYARVCVEIARVFASQAAEHDSNGRGYNEEASMYIYEIDRYLEEATRYIQAAENDLLLADRYRAEAVEKRNEAWSIWRTPGDYKASFGASATKQIAR